jgi:restriction system protein
MEREESFLLHEPDLMLAVLRVAAAGSGTLDACIEQLRRLRRCAQVRELVAEAEVRARLEGVLEKLARAHLIDQPTAGAWRITPRGRRMLAEHPEGVDDSVLIPFRPVRSAGEGAAEPHEAPNPPRSHYDLGYEAYGSGDGLADNPHPADVRAALDWENGWSQARDDERRRLGARRSAGH